MNFIKQYVKIINYSLMGLAFGFSCFYILTNAYHYLEIRKDYSIDFDSQPLIQDIETKLKNINNNLASFNANTYDGNLSNSRMMLIYQNLKSCINSFNKCVSLS